MSLPHIALVVIMILGTIGVPAWMAWVLSRPSVQQQTDDDYPPWYPP